MVFVKMQQIVQNLHKSCPLSTHTPGQRIRVLVCIQSSRDGFPKGRTFCGYMCFCHPILPPRICFFRAHLPCALLGLWDQSIIIYVHNMVHAKCGQLACLHSHVYVLRTRVTDNKNATTYIMHWSQIQNRYKNASQITKPISLYCARTPQKLWFFEAPSWGPMVRERSCV